MNTDSSTSLGGFPAATAPERDTLGTAGPETGIVMSKLNVTSFSKTEDPRDVRLTMSTDRSQNSKAHGIASNQDTGSRTLHQTSLQRKRHYDEHDGNRGPKRTKSSAPEQPIDVGAIEE